MTIPTAQNAGGALEPLREHTLTLPTCQGGPNPATPRHPMGLSHCPLCMGLALLSAIRFLAHGVLVWQLRSTSAAAPALQLA